MTARTLAVVTAGLRDPSSTRLLADRLAASAADALRTHGDEVLVEVVDLRMLAHEIADAMLTGFPSGALARAVETVAGADGVIAVTPVFSASYSGLFKGFFDVLEPEALAGTPVLLAATAGSPRHSLVLEYALRPLFTYLKAVTVPTAVFAAAEDWASAGGGDGTAGALSDRVRRAAAELAGLVHARPPRQASSDELEVTDFESLLRDH